MKFYLIEVAEGDTKIAGKAMYEFDNLNDAEANFHSKMGSAMKSDLFTSELLMVIDSNGATYKDLTRKYVKDVESIAE